MKKIFVLLFSVLLLAFVGCSKQTVQTNPDPPGVKVEYAVDQPAVQYADVTTPVFNVRDVTGERLQSYSSYSKSNANVYVVQDTAEQPPGEADKTFWQLIADNWGSLLLALLGFVELLVRLTPTEKDNSILNMIIKFLNVILPNLKKGGGKFEVRTG
jgi:hypothetical protein